MITILAIVITNIAFMRFLSEPGAYLPQEHKVSESVTILKLDALNSVINDSVKYPLNGGIALSFDKTFHEMTHGVIRPRLNETSMDPDLLQGYANDHEAS